MRDVIEILRKGMDIVFFLNFILIYNKIVNEYL